MAGLLDPQLTVVGGCRVWACSDVVGDIFAVLGVMSCRRHRKHARGRRRRAHARNVGEMKTKKYPNTTIAHSARHGPKPSTYAERTLPGLEYEEEGGQAK